MFHRAPLANFLCPGHIQTPASLIGLSQYHSWTRFQFPLGQRDSVGPVVPPSFQLTCLPNTTWVKCPSSGLPFSWFPSLGREGGLSLQQNAKHRLSPTTRTVARGALAIHPAFKMRCSPTLACLVQPVGLPLHAQHCLACHAPPPRLCDGC